MLSPIVFCQHTTPTRAKAYDDLIGQLKPYRIIEQPSYYKDISEVENKRQPIIPVNLRRSPQQVVTYFNIQDVMTKAFPQVVLQNSHPNESVLFVEDDICFSSVFS